MSMNAIVRAARREAEKRMRADVVITRPDPLDPTAKHAPVYGTEDAPGRARMRYPGLAHEQVPEAAGARITRTRIVVSIPHGVQVNPHDVVRVIRDRDNPTLDGQTYSVGSIDDQSQSSAQRLLCNDIQSGRQL